MVFSGPFALDATVGGSPPLGFSGIAHSFYTVAGLSTEFAEEEVKASSQEELYRLAKRLYMPTNRLFLENWTKRDDKRYRSNDYQAFDPLQFGKPIPLRDGAVQYDHADQSSNDQYTYIYKQLLAEEFIQEFHRLGVLNQGMTEPCLPIVDQLTRSCSAGLIHDTVSNTDAIHLDVLLEITTQLEGHTFQSFNAVQAVAVACRDGVNRFEELVRHKLEAEWLLPGVRQSAVATILQDPIRNYRA